jgi:hypothetical protein
MSEIKKMHDSYDWIVVGGGVSGISIAEILSRKNNTILLIEKNNKLVSETSKVFHEWMHSGSLFSLVLDNLLTLRYLLGATDDLIEYYQTFPRMNLIPSESGVKVGSAGWFNKQHIEYRYRLHKLNPIWLSLVSRSINIIDLLSNHDWLRKRAGSEYGGSELPYNIWLNNIYKQIATNSRFYNKLSPDLTMNSRKLISDLLSVSIQNGLKIVTGESVHSVSENNGDVTVTTDNNYYQAKNVVICSPDAISNLMGIPIKIGYAPIAVVENVPEDEKSFVELDYNIRKCINLLKKGDGVGQAGGITLDNKNDVDPYLEYVISVHKKRNPSLRIIDTYIGLKKELVKKGEDRNYLYHINHHSQNIWSVVLGKFSLAFSMAPEFYRRVYHENPSKTINKKPLTDNNDLISATSWQEIINKDRK